MRSHPQRKRALKSVFYLALCSLLIMTGTNFAAHLVSGFMPRSVKAPSIESLHLGLQSKVRDHLTEKEDELVREFQEIDKRIDVYIKAADRRLLVLTNPNATQKKKEQETWGLLPTGTKLELLQDYKRILEEAEEKMDDALNHNSKAPGLEKALNKLKEAATRQIPQLRTLAAQLTDKKEQSALAEATEEAETITKASGEQ